jgi:hypothetical protein
MTSTTADNPATTDVCGHLIGSLSQEADEKVEVYDIVNALNERAYAIIIMLLALPNAVPGPFIPGLSLVTGLPAFIYACEAALGRPRPRLPRSIGCLKLNRRKVIRHLERARPYIINLEALMRPRWPWLVARYRVAFALCAVFDLVLTLPIPFGNVAAAWAIIVLTFALTRRDGLFVAIGVAAGLGAVAWNVLLVVAGWEATLYFTGS